MSIDQPAPTSGDIVQDVVDLLRAAGLEVRDELGAGHPFAVAGTLDSAAILIEMLLVGNQVPDIAGPPPVERRRDLANIKLPIDAECALEHAALALSKVDPEAHAHVTEVLAQHLPQDSAHG